MRRQRVESSVIASVGYDPTTAVLEVEFLDGGRYRYYAVPPSAHRALMNAESVGQVFARSIRDRYPMERLD